ncbi:hypothetical protein B0X31_07600, partial [Helicobacter pylori]
MQNLSISLRKILFINKSKTTKVKKNPFYSYPHSNNLISFKTALLQTNLKQPHQTTKVKNLFFDSYPYSNNLISFKMTFIG